MIILAALGLGACATDRSIGLSPEIEVTQLEMLPEPRGEISYRIGPQEVLEIEVVGAEQLSGKYLTDENGHIVYPYIGEVRTGGVSPRTASQMIQDALRGRFVLDPQVRVIPEEFPPPSISVGGQVKRPGSYPAVGQPTLLKVVNQAEGLTEYAKTDDVVVQRIVEGQRYVGLYNVGAIQRGNYPDPQLFPNDIVIVGDSPTKRRIDNILQFSPLLAPLVLLINQQTR
ncbi:polysaccharide biosynthesis/export family protein [Erythrobacter sp.]|uniref:polysaccharide biosynthesis/export family protein n=1 Tax=Erythrobacter sp. TaxID=1042 RepID=UPI001425DE57|nr:polysaccharide biosynthesis/export family protein [Erythrobacter sp.]QIQ87553.1 MAG: polysaccharide export protein [Erythrobacter sp.]